MQILRCCALVMAFPAVAGAELRELSTDRPDTTESPYIVDAGHFQVESDLAAMSWGDGGREYTVMALNLKAGLTPFVDLQVMVEPLRAAWRLASPMAQGVGESAVRLKLNVWATTAAGRRWPSCRSSACRR